MQLKKNYLKKKHSNKKTRKNSRRGKSRRGRSRRHLSKMRGGAAAAAYPQTPCYDQSDRTVVFCGVPNLEFLSRVEYTSQLAMYSDHAPIIYTFDKLQPPLQNPFMTLITWNIAQWGNIYNQQKASYNHKFNMQRTETKSEYMQRVGYLVYAMSKLLGDYKPKGNNDPFLFCQELPKEDELRKHLIDELNRYGLALITDDTMQSQFGLIVRQVSNSQFFSVLPKHYYWDYKYKNSKQIFPRSSKDKEWDRFEIYYYEFTNRQQTTMYFYYVNVHAFYTEDKKQAPAVIINFLNRILDVIHIHHFQKYGNINNITVYIIGDFNYNMLSPDINAFVSIQNPNYTLFGNQFLDPPRRVKNIYKISTDQAIGYSLNNNMGGSEPCNVDCLLKIDF
jgi:hypothetical protein